jgi:ribosomal protein S18 acetylase RimI-like enzyme
VQLALERAECTVAVEGDQVVGYVILNTSFFGQAFLPLLVVTDHRRRSGIGTQLLVEAESQCTREKLFASTNESNEAARALFERHGFIPSGRIENLDDTDSELVYCKWLRSVA